MKSNSCRQFAIRLFLSFVFVLVIGFAIYVFIVQITTLDRLEHRRISYAATATLVASIQDPQTLLILPASTVTPTLPPVIPTVQDLSIIPTATPGVPLDSSIPAPVGLLPEQTNYEIVNFLIEGSDRRGPTSAYRTDVILILSVNWSTQTVNLLSIPRDLYVYIPGWGMDRINTAELHQTQLQETHHRLGLLAETIERNLGVRIDHVTRIDFDAFEQWIDSIGVITVPVDCPVEGYLLGPDASSWVPFTLESGMHDLDGAMALWYVRQRIDSSDFDRNRRQQIALRAIWHKSVNSDLISKLPELWSALTQSIETDITLDQALIYAPLFAQLNPDKVESHFLGLDEVNLAQTPNGSSVLVIDPEPFMLRLHQFLTPPTLNRLNGELAIVNVSNASSIPDADRLAAAQLGWLGIAAVPVGTWSSVIPRTQLYDFTGQVKGSSLAAIRSAFGLSDADVLLAQASDTGVNFQLVIGDNYVSCRTSAWQAFAQPE